MREKLPQIRTMNMSMADFYLDFFLLFREMIRVLCDLVRDLLTNRK